jgi:subfamily B ATP-binding cassette protein MsbA
VDELARLLRYVRPYSARLAIAVALMAVVGLCQAAVVVLIGPVIDRILNPVASQDPVELITIPVTGTAIYLDDLLPASLGDVWTLVAVALLVVFVVKGLCDFTANYLVNYAGFSGVRDMRNDVYSVILNQSPAFFQTKNTGSLISSLVSDIEKVQSAFSHFLADLMRQFFTASALLFLLVQRDWKLAAASLIVLPLVLLPTSRIGTRLRVATRRAQDHLAELVQIMHETISGNRVVKAFAMEHFEVGRFEKRAESLFQANMRYVIQQAMASPLIEIFGALMIVGLLAYVRQRIVLGEMSAGQFVSFLTALLMLFQPVKRLNGIYNIFQQALGSAQRVFEYIDHRHDVEEVAAPVRLAPFAHSIEFENVTFSYPGAETEMALRGINLTVKAGEVVALVGPSGSGKSTLMNLLPRFFDPTDGCIRIDGRDLRELSIESLRQQIAIVTQDTFLFDDTLRNNIAYGRPDIPLKKVRSAAGSAIAAEFIDALPDGYQTDLGERGQRLSGGQRQRISIARALLKDAPILLLDEATSHLDSEAELLVQQALSNLIEGRTVIVSAHRLSTIRSADKIVVLQDGRVLDSGTHDGLLRTCELYRRLVKLQSVEV